MVVILVLFVVITAAAAGLVIHDSLLGNVGCCGSTAFDLASLSLGRSYPLAILRVALVNSRCVNVFIVIGLESE